MSSARIQAIFTSNDTPLGECRINGCFPGEDESTTATLGLQADGGVLLSCALHDLGCGSDTTLAQIAAEVLGLGLQAIRVTPADTDTCAYDLGTRASRMTYIVGEAVRKAALALDLAIRDVAALALNAAPQDLTLQRGGVQSARTRISLADLATWLAARNTALPIATQTHRATANPGSFAAHFADSTETLCSFVCPPRSPRLEQSAWSPDAA